MAGYGAPPRTAYGYQDLAMFAQRSASDSYDLQYDDNDIHFISKSVEMTQGWVVPLNS